MTRNAWTTTAVIAVASAIAIGIVASSLPAYACSGQGIGTAAVANPANAPTSKTEPMPSRNGSGSSAGETAAPSDAEQLRAAREMLEARLRALRENRSGGAGSGVPDMQSPCM
jgi:hypothetical protein